MKFRKLYYFNINRKKFLLCIVFLLLVIISSLIGVINVNANERENNDQIISGISQSVSDVVNGIDLSDLENILNDYDNLNLFKGSIKDKVLDILKGNYFVNYSSLLSGILSIFFVDIKEFLPFLFTLLGIGILSNIIGEFGSNSSTKDIVHFVCFGVMIIVIMVVFKDVINITSLTLSIILKQIQIVFPILITLLSTIGSLSTISIYRPLVAILTSGVTFIFNKMLYPMFIILFIFSIISHLTETVKLDKLKGFFSSCFKWSVGIVFTLFAGFLSIQGISAGRFDSISIKATKFAIKSYIPIIGGYLSDGMDFLVLGSVLVKNTIGLVGILILFISIISPIISMLVLKLGFQFVSAILELSGSKRMSSFISDCSKILVYPIVLILGIAFMYIITITLIMCTANIF